MLTRARCEIAEEEETKMGGSADGARNGLNFSLFSVYWMPWHIDE
jgi:hypothetical protein